jgi:hypothetical protein
MIFTYLDKISALEKDAKAPTLDPETAKALSLIADDPSFKASLDKIFVTVIKAMKRSAAQKMATSTDDHIEQEQKALLDSIAFYEKFFCYDGKTCDTSKLIALISGEEVDLNTESQESIISLDLQKKYAAIDRVE